MMNKSVIALGGRCAWISGSLGRGVEVFYEILHPARDVDGTSAHHGPALPVRAPSSPCAEFRHRMKKHFCELNLPIASQYYYQSAIPISTVQPFHSRTLLLTPKSTNCNWRSSNDCALCSAPCLPHCSNRSSAISHL